MTDLTPDDIHKIWDINKCGYSGVGGGACYFMSFESSSERFLGIGSVVKLRPGRSHYNNHNVSSWLSGPHVACSVACGGVVVVECGGSGTCDVECDEIWCLFSCVMELCSNVSNKWKNDEKICQAERNVTPRCEYYLDGVADLVPLVEAGTFGSGRNVCRDERDEFIAESRR